MKTVLESSIVKLTRLKCCDKIPDRSQIVKSYFNEMNGILLMMDCRCLTASIDPSHDHGNNVLGGLWRGGGGGGGLHYLNCAFVFSIRKYRSVYNKVTIVTSSKGFLSSFSNFQLVGYYHCCVLIG